jgi:hypothetical protein
MKSKIVASILLMLSVNANADHRYYGHRNHHSWVAPAIIGSAIVGSTIYGMSQRDYNSQYEDYQYRMREQEMREYRLRQRELEIMRRENQIQNRYDTCNEYYRNDGSTNYYSRNCW